MVALLSVVLFDVSTISYPCQNHSSLSRWFSTDGCPIDGYMPQKFPLLIRGAFPGTASQKGNLPVLCRLVNPISWYLLVRWSSLGHADRKTVSNQVIARCLQYEEQLVTENLVNGTLMVRKTSRTFTVLATIRSHLFPLDHNDFFHTSAKPAVYSEL